jgi:hypothetical protein
MAPTRPAARAAESAPPEQRTRTELSLSIKALELTASANELSAALGMGRF